MGEDNGPMPGGMSKYQKRHRIEAFAFAVPLPHQPQQMRYAAPPGGLFSANRRLAIPRRNSGLKIIIFTRHQ